MSLQVFTTLDAYGNPLSADHLVVQIDVAYARWLLDALSSVGTFSDKQAGMMVSIPLIGAFRGLQDGDAEFAATALRPL